MSSPKPATPKKTDANNGSNGICRVIDAFRSPLAELGVLLQAMKRCIILLTLLIFSQGCKDHEGSPVAPDGSSNDRMKVSELIEKEGELTFTGSSQSSGACTFRFRTDGKVTLDSFAYNICKFPGTFREEQGLILISFDKRNSSGGLPFLDARTDPDVIHLPPLRLKKTPEGMVLIRHDGRTDFNEHWNIYPDAKENIFPFRMVIMNRAEQNADGRGS